MDRNDKEDLVATLRGMFEETSVVVVTHYVGMTVAQMTDLRGKARAAGVGFKVTKNRLTRLALDGTPFAGIAGMFTGPTAIAFSADPVAAAKVVVDYAKGNEKLVILGGGLGETILDPSGIEALTKLPSLDELRAKLLGLVNAPASKLVGVLQAPASDLVGVINAGAGKLPRVLAARGAQQEAA